MCMLSTKSVIQQKNTYSLLTQSSNTTALISVTFINYLSDWPQIQSICDLLRMPETNTGHTHFTPKPSLQLSKHSGGTLCHSLTEQLRS